MHLAGSGDLRMVVLGATALRIRAGDVLPIDDGVTHLGAAAAQWDDIFCVAVTESSDMRLKTYIGDALGLAFIMELKPFSGKWKDKDDQRTHQWLGAQDVAGALRRMGLDPHEQGMWTEAQLDTEGAPLEGGPQALVYRQFIPPIINSLHELEKRLSRVESLIS